MIALVTGGNRGIGREVCRQLAAAGHDVLLTARTLDRARDAARRLGPAVVPMRLDVTREEDAAGAAKEIAERFGRLDALVNNAAINFDSGADPVTEDLEVADGAWRTNVLAPWRLTQAFAPLLRAGREAVIVNVTSGLGSLTRMGASSPAYSVSKAGLNALTRVFADALTRDGVAVHAVSPGWTATDMGGSGGRPIADGAAGIVEVVRSPGSFPSGSFLQDGQHVPW
jgi:NAD(P)-dependent dehydrogenase (short-subunit alcohol dehydrogenase family)